MTEADVKSIALFFYFALLDDRRAVECSIQALSYCQDRKKKNVETKNPVIVVAATAKIWDQIHLKIHRGLPNTVVDSGWLVPKDLDLGAWRDFQKNATNDELLVIIWSKILAYSDQDISEGLGLTVGTVRYRLARAVRKLGAMTHQMAKMTANKDKDDAKAQV